ncbi:uncharacterized protein LOC113475395 [Ciona intestinalis]
MTTNSKTITEQIWDKITGKRGVGLHHGVPTSFPLVQIHNKPLLFSGTFLNKLTTVIGIIFRHHPFSWIWSRESHPLSSNFSCTEKIIISFTVSFHCLLTSAWIIGFSKPLLYFTTVHDDSIPLHEKFFNALVPTSHQAIPITTSAIFLLLSLLTCRLAAGKFQRAVEDNLSYWQGLHFIRTGFKIIFMSIRTCISKICSRKSLPEDDFSSVASPAPPPSESIPKISVVDNPVTEEDLVDYLENTLRTSFNITADAAKYCNKIISKSYDLPILPPPSQPSTTGSTIELMEAISESNSTDLLNAMEVLSHEVPHSDEDSFEFVPDFKISHQLLNEPLPHHSKVEAKEQDVRSVLGRIIHAFLPSMFKRSEDSSVDENLERTSAVSGSLPSFNADYYKEIAESRSRQKAIEALACLDFYNDLESQGSKKEIKENESESTIISYPLHLASKSVQADINNTPGSSASTLKEVNVTSRLSNTEEHVQVGRDQHHQALSVVGSKIQRNLNKQSRSRNQSSSRPGVFTIKANYLPTPSAHGSWKHSSTVREDVVKTNQNVYGGNTQFSRFSNSNVNLGSSSSRQYSYNRPGTSLSSQFSIGSSLVLENEESVLNQNAPIQDNSQYCIQSNTPTGPSNSWSSESNKNNLDRLFDDIPEQYRLSNRSSFYLRPRSIRSRLSNLSKRKRPYVLTHRVYPPKKPWKAEDDDSLSDILSFASRQSKVQEPSTESHVNIGILIRSFLCIFCAVYSMAIVIYLCMRGANCLDGNGLDLVEKFCIDLSLLLVVVMPIVGWLSFIISFICLKGKEIFSITKRNRL